MSFSDLPPDINRLIANLPEMTIGDIHALCRTHRGFNEAVCRQNDHLNSVLREVRERLTDHYDVIRDRTLAELEEDLALPQRNIADITLLRSKGYEKPNYNKFNRFQMLQGLRARGFRGLTNRPKQTLITLLEGNTPEGYTVMERQTGAGDEALQLHLVPESYSIDRNA